VTLDQWASGRVGAAVDTLPADGQGKTNVWRYSGRNGNGSVTPMATDYDAPRRDEVDLGEDSLEELKARRVDAQSAVVDVDETEVAESFELPGADLADEELTVKVLPMQADEFRCSRCFLVHHRSQLAVERNGELICRECA
jgi:Domain of unknown function (DUF4193)